ncbi:MAG: lysylphosphatidylglycerol synthase transmembrane domain-containing protein [Bdellovibrionales bacterium]
MKQILTTFFKFAVAAGLIYWLSTSGKFDLKLTIEVLNPVSFIICCLLVLTNLLLTNLRWYVLLIGQEIKIKFWPVFKLGLIGIFFNFAMPGGVGGDIVKAFYLLKENPDKKTASAFTVLMDRIIGFASMAFLALAALISQWDLLFSKWELQSMALVLVGILVGFVFLVLLSVSPRLVELFKIEQILSNLPKGEKFVKILEAFSSYGKRPMIYIQTLGLSMMAQSAVVGVVYAVAVFLGNDQIDFAACYFAVPLAMMVAAAPIAPAGIGIGQAAIFSFFAYVGVDDPMAGSIGITIVQLMLLLWGLVGAGFYLSYNQKSMESSNA